MESDKQNEWTVGYTTKALKQKKNLPEKILSSLNLLVKEIASIGPIRKNWSHFDSLEGRNIPSNSYHCHLKDGRPTYVVCWCVRDKKIKIVEIYYVGTHEKAPY